MRSLVTLLIVCSVLSAYAQTNYEPIGAAVNSYADEQNPVISPDGQRLYFTRQGHIENINGKRDPGDIWYCERIGDPASGDPASGDRRPGDQIWSEAKHAKKPLNNTQYNGVLGFDSEGRMLVHGHYQANGSPANTQGISAVTASGNGWGIPEALNIPYYYTKSSHRSGTLHHSGNIMLVTLQSYDTRGGEDLYVLFRQSDGSWTEPKNLGPSINTPYQEMTPYLAPDGKTLFFASNGYEGFGSRDIYKSVRLDDSWKNWSNPKNLGATVNSEGTELGYYLPESGAYAYLSSTQNSDGRGDIVKVRISEEQTELLAEADTTLAVPMVVEEPEPVVATADTVATEPAPEVLRIEVRGQVINKSSEAPIPAEIIFRSLKKDTAQTTRVNVASDGTFSAQLPAEDDYALTVASDGFIRARDQLLASAADPEDSGAIVRDYALTPIEVGSTVNLENVLFDRGNATMLPGSYETLDEVVTFLRENSDVEIEVAGHTDNQGRADLNLALSRERAGAVKQYLADQGIDANRITQQGYGGTRPLVSNAIEEERSKNRRVEFTILKK